MIFTENRQMDVALYVGLTVACVVIVSLAFFLVKLLRRKGRDHSLYSMARNGKHFRDKNLFETGHETETIVCFRIFVFLFAVISRSLCY